MKKRLILFLTATALGGSLLSPVIVVGEEFKRQCADIEQGGGQLFADPEGSTTNFDLHFALQTPGRCGGVLFTLYVFDELADCSSLAATDPIAAPIVLTVRGATLAPDGIHGEVVFFRDNADNDGIVAVIATSSQGSTSFDRAPDTGCEDYSTFAPGKGFG